MHRRADPNGTCRVARAKPLGRARAREPRGSVGLPALARPVRPLEELVGALIALPLLEPAGDDIEGRTREEAKQGRERTEADPDSGQRKSEKAHQLSLIESAHPAFP